MCRLQEVNKLEQSYHRSGSDEPRGCVFRLGVYVRECVLDFLYTLHDTAGKTDVRQDALCVICVLFFLIWHEC